MEVGRGEEDGGERKMEVGEGRGMMGEGEKGRGGEREDGREGRGLRSLPCGPGGVRPAGYPGPEAPLGPHRCTPSEAADLGACGLSGERPQWPQRGSDVLLQVVTTVSVCPLRLWVCRDWHRWTGSLHPVVNQAAATALLLSRPYPA